MISFRFVPISSQKVVLFFETPGRNIFLRSLTLNCALDRYSNIIVIGDINIDTQNITDPGFDELASFCDMMCLVYPI